MEVYNVQGHGFLEDVCQECLEHELLLRGIHFDSQPRVELRYKDRVLKQVYRPDLLVCDEIIVELKALMKLSEVEFAQLLNYMRSTEKRVGYLLNFGNPEALEWKRFVL